jgi:MYXO-CTERM domain-containing protein
VIYALIETDAGGGTPSQHRRTDHAAGGNPSTTLVKDDIDVTSTAEPATVALMATGLVGLVPLIRRRRKV